MSGGSGFCIITSKYPFNYKCIDLLKSYLLYFIRILLKYRMCLIFDVAKEVQRMGCSFD